MPDPLHIAIIDNDASVRSGIGALVRSAGLQASLFASAEAFLAARQPCACVVTDIQMPGMDGLALLEELSRRDMRVPAIVVTGFPEPAIRVRAMAAGAAGFFAKPFESCELIACIERLLREEAPIRR